MVTLGMTDIQNIDPLPMIPHQTETQFLSPLSQSQQCQFQVYFLHHLPPPVPCWCGKLPTPGHVDSDSSRIYPHQLGRQTLALQDPPRISWTFLAVYSYYYPVLSLSFFLFLISQLNESINQDGKENMLTRHTCP